MNITFDEETKLPTDIYITPKNTPNLFHYEEKITNITAIIGKNGAGKTNILDLIGAKRDLRNSFRFGNSSYFLIHHHSENIFIIEGGNHELLAPILIGLDAVIRNDGPTQNPYSLIVELKNKKFQVQKYLGSTQMIRKDTILLNYRNHYDKIASRNSKDYEVSSENSEFFSRVYLFKPYLDHVQKYKIITDFSVAHNENVYEFKSLKLKRSINITLTTNIQSDIPNSDILKQVTKKFNHGLRKIRKDQTVKKNKYSSKESFINKLAYQLFELAVTFFYDEVKTDLKDIESYILTLPKNPNYVEYLLNLINKTLTLKVNMEEDNYFTNKDKASIINVYKEYFRLLDQLPNHYFSDAEITIPTDIYDEKIAKLFELFQNIKQFDPSLNFLIELLSVSYGALSSGEDALIAFFSAIYNGMSAIELKSAENIILLLDEPDIYMHPEWSRMLLDELIHFLNSLNLPHKKFQIIMTTHSPFVVSDLPKENVIALEKHNDSDNCTIVDLHNTFAANIHTLLAEEFFMTTTVGEYAKEQINNVIKLLSNAGELKDCEHKKIKYIIDIIGEPVLKEKLTHMYENIMKKDTNHINEVINQLLTQHTFTLLEQEELKHTIEAINDSISKERLMKMYNAIFNE